MSGKKGKKYRQKEKGKEKPRKLIIRKGKVGRREEGRDRR